MPGCVEDAQDVPPTPSVMQRAACRGFVLLQLVRGCLREGRYGQPWTGLRAVESDGCFRNALSNLLYCSAVALWSGVGKRG